MCSVNFWHQQDSNSSFKGSIGHVTSYIKLLYLAHTLYTSEGKLSQKKNVPMETLSNDINKHTSRPMPFYPRSLPFSFQYKLLHSFNSALRPLSPLNYRKILWLHDLTVKQRKTNNKHYWDYCNISLIILALNTPLTSTCNLHKMLINILARLFKAGLRYMYNPQLVCDLNSDMKA